MDSQYKCQIWKEIDPEDIGTVGFVLVYEMELGLFNYIIDTYIEFHINRPIAHQEMLLSKDSVILCICLAMFYTLGDFCELSMNFHEQYDICL